MVYSNEVKFSTKSISIFKNITEGKPVLVHKKYLDKFSIEIDCKKIIATNDFSKLLKGKIALRSRVLVLDMVSNFIGRGDIRLLAKLEAEIFGIFNRIIAEFPLYLIMGNLSITF